MLSLIAGSGASVSAVVVSFTTRPKKQPVPFTIRGPKSSRRCYHQRPKKQSPLPLPKAQKAARWLTNIRRGIGI